MANELITPNPEQETTETSLEPRVVQQLEDAVVRAEGQTQEEEEQSPVQWYYSIPCAGVRYYRY